MAPIVSQALTACPSDGLDLNGLGFRAAASHEGQTTLIKSTIPVYTKSFQHLKPLCNHHWGMWDNHTYRVLGRGTPCL